MTAEGLFSIANLVAVAGWILLIAAPRNRRMAWSSSPATVSSSCSLESSVTNRTWEKLRSW